VGLYHFACISTIHSPITPFIMFFVCIILVLSMIKEIV
jgi:hypothetical protein